MTKTILEPARTLPVVAEADVVVVGGGTAGFIAATAAARTGAKTILIERFGYLGGCTTTTYNTTIGLFFDSDGYQIIKGIPWEFVQRMKQEGEAFADGARSPEIWPPTTKKVALDMVTEAGVDLLFYTWVTNIIKSGDMVDAVIVENKGGRAAILGKVFIDCSGDADLAAWAGAPCEMTAVEDLQQVSCDYLACGVDSAKVIAWARANRGKLIGARGLDIEHKGYGTEPMVSFTIPQPQTQLNASGQVVHVGVMPTVKLLVYNQAVRLQGNSDIDPLDPRALTYAEVNGLRGALEHLAYLRQNIPGFEHVFLVAQNHLGVRETRRIVGDYMMSIDDLHNQARFEDVVALNCRALDYHLRGTVFKISFLKGHHDVPLRALLPKNVANLLVAGRCISCDHLAQASLRGAATCMATGHAAGVAAAIAAKGNGRVRETSVKDIQRMLLQQDAILSTENAPGGR